MVAKEAPLLYRWLQAAILFLARLLTHFDLQGIEHIPRSGSMILTTNHLHFMDVVIPFAVVPRRMTVFAADKWRRPPLRWLLDYIGNAIYVARGEPDRQALNAAIAVLRAGGALGVAPEGTRSRTGGLQHAKDGATYLASRTGAPLVPCVVWGHENIFSSWLRGRRARVFVRIGAPILLPESAARARTAELQGYTDHLMLCMARLLPAEYRGVYAGRV